MISSEWGVGCIEGFRSGSFFEDILQNGGKTTSRRREIGIWMEKPLICRVGSS
jgi:hypothetical protein